MIMSGRIFKGLISVMIFSGIAFIAGAQANSQYSPYSLYGIGDLSTPGTAYNRTMAGVGIANRNNRFINITNPAAVTARDSLAFMADFSLYGNNVFFRQGENKSINNVFNINDCVMSFPIWKSSAMMVGIMPYSGTGFGYAFDYQDKDIIGQTGNVSYAASGTGAIYQVFAAAGVTFWKKLSLGAQCNYYFGNLCKKYYGIFSNSAYKGFQNGNELKLNGVSGKFGLQYEQTLGAKSTVGIGATYSMNTKMKGYIEDYSYSDASSVTDTLYHKTDTLDRSGKIRFGSEIGVGICYKYEDKWMIEFDYTRSDWRNSGFDNTPGFMGNARASSTSSVFSSSVAQSFRLGFEITPNRNDIRYYMKKVTYRGGAYYKDEYYMVDGKKISAMGLTFGATFPVFRWYNGISVGIDLGQRGTTDSNLIRERYVNLSIGFNIFDIWFRKPQYD